MNSLQWLRAESESDFVLTQMLETRAATSVGFQSELVWMEARLEKSLIEVAARQPPWAPTFEHDGKLAECVFECASKLNYDRFN